MLLLLLVLTQGCWTAIFICLIVLAVELMHLLVVGIICDFDTALVCILAGVPITVLLSRLLEFLYLQSLFCPLILELFYLLSLLSYLAIAIRLSLLSIFLFWLALPYSPFSCL